MENQSGTKKFIRGGQTFLHNFSMFNQVASKVLLVSLILFCLFLVVTFMYNSNAYDRYVGVKWAGAKFEQTFNRDNAKEWMLPNNQTVMVSSSDIVNSKEVNKSLNRLKFAALTGLFESSVMYLVCFIVIARGFKQRGNAQGKSRIIRGMALVTPKELTKQIKKSRKYSPYRIAGIPLPLNSETQHIQFIGTTGAGKTVAIRELLQTIRARGERAIIFDKGGTYISRFYNEQTDVILNPLDERGRAWDVWQECEDKADFEALAEALMPMPAGNSMDPFWVNAARMIFVSTANELKKDPNRSNLMLLKYLLTKDLGAIHELIKHTESESLVSDKVEKTALNVKSVMATYLKSLGYLKTEGDFFSIRDWIGNDNSNEWLFVSSNGRKHPTLRPLISAWINTAAKELLSLNENPNRRVWFILDELATLHMLPFLEIVKSESRKFGGCFVLGYHGNSQLRKIYGSDGASNLSNFCSTQIFMRLNDVSNQKWASDNLGTYEVEEVNEGISYGANTMRDGISISRTVKEKKVALSSEIKLLNDLEGYLKVKGSYPVSRMTFDYVDYPKINKEFIEREGNTDVLSQEVNELVEKYEDPILAQDHDKALEEDSAIKQEQTTTPKELNKPKEKDVLDFYE